MSSIPTSKRGRKLPVGDLDKEVMNFIYNLREFGGVVNGKIAVAAAKGIINSKNKEFLVENGSRSCQLLLIGNGWVNSLFKRMNFLRRKKTTSTKPKMIGEVTDQLQRDYHRNIYTVQQSAMVPQQLIVNIDQTPVKMVLSRSTQ